MRECGCPPTGQVWPSVQADPSLTADTRMARIHGERPGGKRVFMHRYLPLVAASYTPPGRQRKSFGQEGAADDERANEAPDWAGSRCATRSARYRAHGDTRPVA